MHETRTKNIAPIIIIVIDIIVIIISDIAHRVKKFSYKVVDAHAN